MANEIILYEFRTYQSQDTVEQEPSKTTFIDTAGDEVQLDDETKMIAVEVKASASAIQWKLGATGLSVTANTDGNSYTKSGDKVYRKVTGGKYFKSVADA